MTYLKEAFFDVCKEAKPAHAAYVSLYIDIPFYGGPEEGGWWGSDSELVAYHLVRTDDEAELVRSKVTELAEKLNEDAKREFGDQCLAEMEWLDARGLDADFLPEPDGEVSYSVLTENTPGEFASKGCRHYC